MRIVPLTCVLILALAAAAVAEPTSRSVLREYVKHDGHVDATLTAATGWNSVQGFSWQMYLVDDDSGESAPTSSARMFRTGQAFKIRIEAYTDLWIYVMNVEPNDKMVLLLPESGEQHMQVKAGETVNVPPDGQFRFTGDAGVEKFRIVASPTKLPWANTETLWKLENGERLRDNEERVAMREVAQRSKSIGAIQTTQAKRQAASRGLYAKSLPTLLTELKMEPTLKGRVKDVLLLPPPSEGEETAEADRHRNDAILVSERTDATDTIVIDVRLKHE